MIFGHLSESEVKSITALLDSGNIPYEVKRDQSVLESNKESVKNDLRYLFPPNLSTSILAIEIRDDVLIQIEPELKMKLADFGISNEVPEEFLGMEFGEVDHSDVLSSRNSKSMYSKWHVFGAIVIIAIVYLLATGKIQPKFFN